MASNKEMSNLTLEENNTFDEVTPSQIDYFDGVTHKIKKIWLEKEEESTLVIAKNVPSETFPIKYK